jgi:hypothetical protein
VPRKIVFAILAATVAVFLMRLAAAFARAYREEAYAYIWLV